MKTKIHTKETKDKYNLLGIEANNYGECGWCRSSKHTVTLTIPFDIWSQWLYISSKMGGTEWGGIFSVKDGVLTNFKIPKQEVSSALCEFKEDLGGNGIVHSHHNMGAFHSHQDDTQSRNLYTYSIVLSNSGYTATMKKKLPCDGFGYVAMNIILSNLPDIDFNKITEKPVFSPIVPLNTDGQQRYFEDETYLTPEELELEKQELEDELELERQIALAKNGDLYGYGYNDIT